jgi:3-keto-disaccharide hydrolase
MLFMNNPGKRHAKRNVSIRLVVSIITLLLMMLISGVLIFFYAAVNKPGQAKGNATQTTQTKTPVSTGPSITQPLFSDDFGDQNKGWAVGSAYGYTRVISNNTLTLANENHTTLTESLPTDITFSDFSLTVKFTLLQANADDSVGLYLRGDTNLDHDYRIDFYGNTAYSISKEYLDTQNLPRQSFLRPPTATFSLRPTGKQNTVMVMMKGPTMVLTINGVVTNSITDDAYASGQIALFVHNSRTSNEVEAAFSSVVVYPLPTVTPTP